MQKYLSIPEMGRSNLLNITITKKYLASGCSGGRARYLKDNNNL